MTTIHEVVTKFCDSHAVKIVRMAEFASKARMSRPFHNKARTRVFMDLRAGNMRARVEVDIYSWTWKRPLVEALLRCFKLNREWSTLVRIYRLPQGYAQDTLRAELARRMGNDLFDKLYAMTSDSKFRQDAERKLLEHRARVELNKTEAQMRRALEIGVSPRQLRKLVRQLCAEQAMEQVHAS